MARNFCARRAREQANANGMKNSFIIGSRGSKLALWQAHWVKSQLAALRPRADVRIEIIKTSGDVMRDVQLVAIGGKGAFTKELEEALLADHAETNALIARLEHLPTRAACTAERALLFALGGGCQVPIAAHATVNEGRLHLAGLVASMRGDEIIRATIEDDTAQAARAG